MRRRVLAVALGLALLAAVLTVVLAPRRDPRDVRNMSLPEAALLGTVEGLTEYLPVSSTGHLLVVQRGLGLGTAGTQDKDAADAFAVCVQLGAILAVLGLYVHRAAQLGRGLLGRDEVGRRLWLHLGTALLPAAVLGLLCADAIKARLFAPLPVVAAWAVGGLAILLVARRRPPAGAEGDGDRALEQLTVRMALWIGLAQGLALWPGVSRSLVTIVAGVLAGLSLGAAVEFSFLLGALTLTAATGYDALRHGGDLLRSYSPPALVVGLAFAFVSAVLAVRWMVGYLKGHGLALFGWYRLAAAALVGALLAAGWL